MISHDAFSSVTKVDTVDLVFVSYQIFVYCSEGVVRNRIFFRLEGVLNDVVVPVVEGVVELVD